MGLGRKLEGVRQGLILPQEQRKLVQFLTNTENAQKINSLVEDIREALIDYQVCASNYLLLPCLILLLDFIATRYL